MPIQKLKNKRVVETGSPLELGVSTIYRTEKVDPYFKGKAIWGIGRYFSLSLEDAKKINSSGDASDIKPFKLSPKLRLMKFDLTWRTDPARSDFDYEAIHKLIKPSAKSKLDGIGGFVILSNSVQYAFSQVVVFPEYQDLIKKA